ncbi:TonB-dependent siderophore receptor [Duganella phyllosphaerae]|uniref:Fe(3+)-pyochelin receptor n=1 Tax=Duganella phyllosphaerae TaxID=762836 RepID=A0A1E7WGP2_9BURK|nr:TonB-dependent siderophore receptor [Duganella phyllosphaerae]OEZ97611.1 Fe(3+)-pyochelin receptor precursor [Duganella phyllosphaerae]
MFHRAGKPFSSMPAMRPVRLAARLALLCASAAITFPLAHAADAADAADAVAPARADGDRDALLPTVTVTGTSDRVTTENSGSFGSRKTSIVKGLESVREIAQPVTVLTRQFIEDRALLNLTDLMLATPGIAVDYTDSERITYHSRGYQIDAMQIDGLTITQGGSAFAQPDAAVLDRVEVLRGASGMLRGSGNPSATVNLMRKRPTRDFQASATAVLGSWDRRRAEGDIAGALNDAGTVRARLVAVREKKDSFQKAMQEDRQVLYGVVEADLSSDTLLTASLQRTELDATGAWGGMPAKLDGSSMNLPRDTFLGASWNRWNRANEQAFVELEHRFDNGWSAKASAGYLHLKMDPNGFKQSYIARPTGSKDDYLFGVTTSQYTGDDSQQDNYSLSANGPFTLLGRQHKLVVGAETLRTRTVATAGLGNQFPLNNIDIRNWDPYSTYPENDLVTVNTLQPTFVQQQGVYATTSLSLMDSLTALAGVRLSWYEYRAPAAPATSYKVERQTTPFVGLVYDITKKLNAYVSYTEIFTPQNVKDVNNNMLKPITGEDYEAGLKGEFFGGKLNASAGIFRINNVGRAVEDSTGPATCAPSNPTGRCRIAGGKTESQGWEAELSGELMPGWSIQGGYTNTRTKYVVDTAANTNQPLRAIDPRHQLRFFSNYRLAGLLKGWTVGGGANIQSDATVTGSGLSARQGGYSVLNAMAGYRFNDRYSVQINVNNLADKTYYKRFAPTGLAYYYGDPRNVVVTLRAAL